MKHPYIFSNFNGTAADVDVLATKPGMPSRGSIVGSKRQNVFGQPLGSCENSLYVQEFLAWPWMNILLRLS